VGDGRYSTDDPAQLVLAAQWLAALHTGAAAIPAARALPDAGPARYRNLVDAARTGMRANLGNPALEAGDVTRLERLLSDLDELASSWDAVERLCRGLPSTLVHGDVQRKNVYVRHGPGGVELVFIDWELAGWGVPAADLTKIDLSAYHDAVRESWPTVREDDVRRLAAVGHVFQLVAAIAWQVPQLAYDTAHWLSRPLSHLAVYQERLDRALWNLREYR